MKRAVLTAIAVLAALYAIAVTWRQNEQAAGLDFYIYFVNAQIAGRADVPNVYAPEVQERVGEEYYERAQRGPSELRKYDAGRRRRLDNVSSPFLYTTLRWVSRDYDFVLRQYHALVLLAFIAGVLLIARRVGVSWAAALALLAALLLWYRGFEADLRVGNVNSLQLLLIGAALWSPPFLAGTLLGILVAFKPNLILIALLLAVSRVATRDWRRLRIELAGGVAGGALAFVAAWINYRTPRVWIDWLGAANQFWHRLQTREERNVAPALSLFREHGTALSYAIAAALIAIVCIAIFRAKRKDDPLVTGLAIAIYLLSAPVVWLHYMVLALPLAIALLRNRWTAIVSVLALAMIAEEPFELLFRTPVYPHDAAHIAPALIALFACGVWLLNRHPPAIDG